MNKHLSSLLAVLLLAVAVMTGQQAMAENKTVTYTIGYTGTSTMVVTPDVAGFDGSSAAINVHGITGSIDNFVLNLHDGIVIAVNLRNSSGDHRMYLSNDGISFNFAASISTSCTSKYIRHIAMKDHNNTAIMVFSPNVPPQAQTNFSFDVDVDLDKLGASGAPSTVQEYPVISSNTSFTIKTITITYGTDPRNYNITYTNAVNGQNGVTNNNRTFYNVITSNFNVTAPTRTGYTFDGFTYTDATHPPPPTPHCP